MIELNSTEFLEALFIAIRNSLATITMRHPGERISGFALRVDDEVSSVGHAACTEEFLTRCPELRDRVSDWPYHEGSESFSAVKQSIRASHQRAEEDEDDTQLSQHIDAAFEAFALALARVRAEHLIPDTALLLAVGTDPGPAIRSRELTLARTLNPLRGATSAAGGDEGVNGAGDGFPVAPRQ
jgi:hypothetical protein